LNSAARAGPDHTVNNGSAAAAVNRLRRVAHGGFDDRVDGEAPAWRFDWFHALVSNFL